MKFVYLFVCNLFVFWVIFFLGTFFGGITLNEKTCDWILSKPLTRSEALMPGGRIGCKVRPFVDNNLEGIYNWFNEPF